MKKHEVTLSNGQKFTITENAQDNKLHLGVDDGRDDWWIGDITPDGILSSSTAGGAIDGMVRNLVQ